MTVLVALATIAGTIPSALDGPSRAVWVGENPSQSISCRLQLPSRWECDGVSGDAHGIVALIGVDGMAYAGVGLAEATSVTVRRWGRALVIQPGTGNVDDLARLQLASSAPERSAVRPLATRFVPVKNTGVDIVRVSRDMFWVASDDPPADAFLTLDSPMFAATRIPLATLFDGDVESFLYVSALLPQTLIGRVEDARGADATAADVELFELLHPVGESHPVDELLAQPMIRTGVTRSGADGSFSFERLASGPFLITVIDGNRGRGTAFIRSPAEPVVIRLSPPSRATGRVLRNQLPVAGARVRFVPDIDALRASTDGRELASQEQTSGSDGRFELMLPPVPSGLVQISAPDGASIRVPVVGHGVDRLVALGDIALPEPHRLLVRVMTGDVCVMFTVGPIGRLGLTILRESSASGSVHWFEIPEPGQWGLYAECQGGNASVDPSFVSVAAGGPDQTIDVRLIR